MNVLFVGSGNKTNGQPSILIVNQAKSLIEEGVEIDYFLIQGKGFGGYLKNYCPLRKKIASGKYDVIHAHYSLSGILVSMSSFFLTKPKKVVSLMGSDAQVKGLKKLTLRFFIRFIWDTTIVKSQQMSKDLRTESPVIIPNGVNLDLFAEEIIPELKTILFAANPNRPSKNVQLAYEAIEIVKKTDENVQFKLIHGISHEQTIREIKKSSCVLLTSLWEGSPNIIKEAMACERPIVSTNVGDVSWLLEGVNGCYVNNWDKESIAKSISKALKFSAMNINTNGRKKLLELNLDSKSIAKRIIQVYKS